MNLIVEPSKKNTLLPDILKAAVHLFVERGIEGTTTKDIAREGGVSEGALYRHFKSKDALAWYIFSTHLNDFSMRLMSEVSRQRGVKEKIRAYVRMCFESFEADRDLFTYLIVSEHRELRSFPETFIHPGIVALRLLEEGQKAGEIRKMEIYVAASLLLGTIIRCCIVRGHPGTLGNLKHYIDETVESLWNALKT